MLTLIPEWAHNYPEFWDAIRKRNQWFIRLRFSAVMMLLIFLLVGEYVLDFRLNETQEIAISLITVSIFIYNLVIYYLSPKIKSQPNKFNHMHLSLIQMVLDLSMLMLLVYFTGGYSSQLYLFFIFHMIIGSMILPGYIIYLLASLVVFIFGGLISLEHFGFLTHYRIEGLFIVPDEHKFTFDIFFMLVFSAMMYISVFLANTIAKRLYRREQQLYESLENEKKAEITKQRYIMGVVHEIKTPISAAKSILELITNGYLGEVGEKVNVKVKRTIVRIDEAIELINNILRLSRLRLLNVSVKEEVNVTDLFHTIIERIKDKADSKKIKVELKKNRSTNKIICGDRVLLELALSNLLSNSLKYNSENGRVVIELSSSEDALLISIDDDGIGIPNKELSNIYDQFYRAANVRSKSKYEGSGIGLSLVKEIIERHNGAIEIKTPSRIGRENRPGVSVNISLPYEEQVLDSSPENNSVEFE